ncbi:MAG: hypothetical protein ABI592_03200 [Acidobacteriota bacterium]
MSGLPASLAAVLAVLLVLAAAGAAAARALFPSGRRFAAERAGWSLAAGLAGAALVEGACLTGGAAPSRWIVLGGVVLLAALGIARPVPSAPGFDPRTTPPAGVSRFAAAWLPAAGALVGIGVALYALRALTEPMWANDYLAIWGLKGRTLFASGAYPAWLRDPAVSRFSHPEYPLGLPLLYAAVATLLGRWDDHAGALLFPAIQCGTLLVLAGWLRRRGASREIAWSAAAILALFEPLYSGFLTGMADVPLSAALLLFGTALSDAVDDADAGAIRRLAAASVFAGALKNEGLFLAAAGAILAFAAEPSRGRRVRIGAAAFVPALAVAGWHRAALGPATLGDFDFGLLAPARWGELAARLFEAIGAAATLAAPAWPILLCAAVLLGAGRRRPDSLRLLGLVAAAAAAYVLLPAFAVRGPLWLASTTLPRTTGALAPLAAAAIALRWSGETRSNFPAGNNEGT